MMDKIYHRLFESENGKWCVEYTVVETNIKEIKCFDTNKEATDFYMS